MEPGDSWSLVRLANGKEGYVLNRYLVAQPTSAVRLEQLQITYDTIKQQADTLLEENTRFKNEKIVDPFQAAIHGAAPPPDIDKISNHPGVWPGHYGYRTKTQPVSD